MVIEPLSLIFFRVPSCAAAGTARARAKAARISVIGRVMSVSLWAVRVGGWMGGAAGILRESPVPCPSGTGGRGRAERSEEHTSELQSRPHLVCRLLLEKKKNYDLSGLTQ